MKKNSLRRNPFSIGTLAVIMYTLHASRSTVICAAEIPVPLAQSSVTLPDTNLALSPDTTLLEEGKALYENGQFIAALGKFITLNKKVNTSGGKLVLCNIDPQIYEVFQITKLDKLFKIEKDEQVGLQAF